MNLWAKRAGLLLSAAVLIFLISCEDDSFLLGFRGKKKFEGNYHEIVFDGDKSSVLLVDSVFTDHKILSNLPINPVSFRYLLGQYNDPEFGTVRSQGFAQFLPNNNPDFPPYFNTDEDELTLDSVTVQLRFDYYLYGSLGGDIAERVSVHRLTDSLTYGKRYTNNSTVPYDPTPLGELSFDLERIVYDLTDDAGRDSSFYLRGTLGSKLPGGAGPGWDFAEELFAYVQSKGDSALVGRNIKGFYEQFYGLAFIPTTSTGILGYNPMHATSLVTLHYQSLEEDSLTLSFQFYPYEFVYSNAMTNITTSRIGELANLPAPQVPYHPLDDSKRYIQDGSTVITELDLSDFYSFIDTLDNIIINSAELSLEVINPTASTPPPASLYALLMKEEDGKIVPLEMSVEEDSLKWREFSSAVFTELINFAISNELTNQSPLTLSYNRSTKKYVGYATMFFQKMFDNKDKPELNIEHIGFYPATAPLFRNVGLASTVPAVRSGIGNDVNRAILKTSGIKLKLYYTKTNLP